MDSIVYSIPEPSAELQRKFRAAARKQPWKTGTDGSVYDLGNGVLAKSFHPNNEFYYSDGGIKSESSEPVALRDWRVSRTLEKAGVPVPEYYGMIKPKERPKPVYTSEFLNFLVESLPLSHHFPDPYVTFMGKIDGDHIVKKIGPWDGDYKFAIQPEDIPIVKEGIADAFEKARKVGFTPYSDFLHNVLYNKQTQALTFIDVMRWRHDSESERQNYTHRGEVGMGIPFTPFTLSSLDAVEIAAPV